MIYTICCRAQYGGVRGASSVEKRRAAHKNDAAVADVRIIGVSAAGEKDLALFFSFSPAYHCIHYILLLLRTGFIRVW